MSRKGELFGSTPADTGVHPDYQRLRDSVFHGAARDLMDSIFLRMGDPDGTFVQEFRTQGFHSRLFELGCFAYLDSTGFSIDRTHDRPDFLASRAGLTIGLEATAANPTAGQSKDISAAGIRPWSPRETETNVSREFPRRMLSVLTNKLEKRYDLLPHCHGMPLVLAVAPYFEPGSVFHVDVALVPCLFEIGNSTESVEPFDPFFSLPGSEAVSAVIYCNQFTVSRFVRMASKGAIRPGIGFTHGFAYVPGEAGRNTLVEYRYDLSNQPDESWAQGVTIFHNPHALLALPNGVLQGTSEFRVRGKKLVREVHSFHPLTVTMIVGG